MPVTTVRGKTVPLPGTLGEIRAALPEDQRKVFDEAMYDTPLDQIAARALLDWALPPEAREEDDEAAARVRGGDFSGLVDADGTAFVL